MKNALLVIATTPHIRTYLQMTDPKALEQVENALTGVEIVTGELSDEGLESIVVHEDRQEHTVNHRSSQLRNQLHPTPATCDEGPS